MKIKTEYIFFFIYFVIILPLLFLPLGLDYSIFLLGGKTIAEGGKLYIDFIDIKPPFVYYFFFLLYLLFGFNSMLYQIFNLVLLFISALLLQKIVFSVTNNKWLGYISPVPMLFYLVSLNYNFIVQLETFFLPLFFLICYLLFKKETSPFNTILLGILLGVIFSIKYTFGIMLLPVGYLLYKQKIYDAKYYIYLLVPFVLVSISQFILILLQEGTLKYFLYIVQFLKYYQNVLGADFFSIKEYLNNLSYTFGTLLSLFFSILGFYGFWISLKRINNFHEVEREFYLFLLISLIALIFSIIVEHQFVPYNYHRLLPILTIYISYGILELYRETKSLHPKLQLVAFSLFLALFLFLSPLSRYGRNVVASYFFFANEQKYAELFENPLSFNVLLKQQKEVAKFLAERISENDTFLVVGQSTQLYIMVGKGQHSAFPLSIFVLSDFPPPKEWKERFVSELNTAKYIVLQKYDYSYLLTRNLENATSYTRFIENPTYKRILEDKFTLVFQTYSYLIYKRRE
jgi:hypothetical protein